MQLQLQQKWQPVSERFVEASFAHEDIGSVGGGINPSSGLIIASILQLLHPSCNAATNSMRLRQIHQHLTTYFFEYEHMLDTKKHIQQVIAPIVDKVIDELARQYDNDCSRDATSFKRAYALMGEACIAQYNPRKDRFDAVRFTLNALPDDDKTFDVTQGFVFQAEQRRWVILAHQKDKAWVSKIGDLRSCGRIGKDEMRTMLHRRNFPCCRTAYPLTYELHFDVMRKRFKGRRLNKTGSIVISKDTAPETKRKNHNYLAQSGCCGLFWLH